jgi:DNA-binding SARP family transcriptional activator
LEVRDSDRAVDVGTPKQRAVLAALLFSANQVVSLDRLIDQLWGAEPPAAATSSLQAYVANLRRVLELTRAARAPATILLTRPPGYLLRVNPGDLDAARFEELTTQGRRLLTQGRPHAASEVLGEALGLWRGPPLPELAAYDFATTEIRQLEELRLAASETQVEAALALGRHQETVGLLERLIAEHPWRERPRELLMLACYRCGRQAEALELMAQTRRVFAEELGIDPGPGLQQLHAAILRQDPDLTWRPPRAEPDPPLPRRERTDDQPVEPVTHVTSHRLVGRERPLAAARNALDDTVAGRGHVVLVAGEPGIGKTRLVQELAEMARARRVDVAWGRCNDNEGAPPLWPWTQVLRTLRAIRPIEELAEAAKRAGPALAPLVPDLAGDGVAFGPVTPEHSRFLLYDATTRLLLELAARQPLLLIVEDLHWADSVSLELAGHLAEHLTAAPVFLVGTFRDTETTPALSGFLARIARESASTRLKLTGLRADEVADMITERVERPVNITLTSALHARTDGNPFFLTELIRLLRSEDLLDDAAAWPIPEGVRDVLRRRIDRLPEQTVTLLTIAAVVGRTVDLDVLEKISGLDEDAALTTVEAAVVAGLLVEDPERLGRYRFVHALVRETLNEGLPGVRRARMHARTWEALQILYGERHIDALAHHAWQAGPAVPAEHALPHILAAAETAERTLAYERAIEQLHRALHLLPRLDPSPDTGDRELDIQHNLVRLLFQTRGYAAPGVASTMARVRELAVQRSHALRLADSLFALAIERCVAADFQTAAALGEELMALAHDAGTNEILRAAHHTLGVVNWHLGRLELADRHLAEAIVLADERGGIRLSLLPEDPAVSSRGFRSAVRWLLGDPHGAQVLRAEALARAAGSDPFTRAYALFFAAKLAAYERDLNAMRPWVAEASTLCRQHGFTMLAGIFRVFDGWAAALCGQPGADRIRAAQDAFQATGARALRHFICGLRAEAELVEGRPDDARRSLDEAFAEINTTGERFYEPQLRRLELTGLRPSPTRRAVAGLGGRAPVGGI